MGRMVSLGRVAAPKPINLPSQRLENNGQDPNVHLVPTGTHTWNASGDAQPHPAVARSALVAHPGGDAPAWGSQTTWGGGGGAQSHDTAPYRRDPRPPRADSFPDLHNTAGAGTEHSDRSLGFVDEAPGSGVGGRPPGGAAHGAAASSGYGGSGFNNYQTLSYNQGHAAYPGERAYGDGRDRRGWGDRPPPPEGWSNNGHGGHGYDTYGRGYAGNSGGGYDQHGYHRANASGYDQQRDPRLQHRHDAQSQGYGGTQADAPVARPLPTGPPPLPPGPPPPWAKQSEGAGGGETRAAPVATEPPPPPPLPAPPPGAPGGAQPAERMHPGAVRVLTRPSATPASPGEFSSANLPEHLRDLRLKTDMAPKKLWTPGGEAVADGGRGGKDGRGASKKAKGEQKQKAKVGDASVESNADGTQTSTKPKDAKEPKKKQPKKDGKKNAKSAGEASEDTTESTPVEGTSADGKPSDKKSKPKHKRTRVKQNGGKKGKGDGAGDNPQEASSEKNAAGPGTEPSSNEKAQGAGAGAEGTPKQPKKDTPKSGGGASKSKPRTKSPSKDDAGGDAEAA